MIIAGIFDDLRYGKIKPPQAVRCVNCGEMAILEDWDGDPGYLECPLYLCEGCDWWTEWEIVSDGEGGIESSSLYYREPGSEDSISWCEVRHLPGFWMPEEDGLTVPDYALRPLEKKED